MNKFKLNKKGVGELLKSKRMKELVSEKAETIKNKCGTGYETSVYVGRSRVNSSVKAKTRKAKQDNLENNTILKALR